MTLPAGLPGSDGVLAGGGGVGGDEVHQEAHVSAYLTLNMLTQYRDILIVDHKQFTIGFVH